MLLHIYLIWRMQLIDYYKEHDFFHQVLLLEYINQLLHHFFLLEKQHLL
jgi:hypothetical protein